MCQYAGVCPQVSQYVFSRAKDAFVCPQVSQYVFEETFNLRFAVPFTQHNATVSGATLAALAPVQVARVRRLNGLDLELYEFAKRLMFRR